MSNPFEHPSSLRDTVPESAQQQLGAIHRELLHPTEKPFPENSGYIALPADTVTLQCGTGQERSILTVKVPDDGTVHGTDTFDERMTVEQNLPKAQLTELSTQLNQFFSGASHSESPISIPIDTRIALHSTTVYESSEGQFIAVPIVPNTPSQRFGGHIKQSGTSLVRGNQHPQTSRFLRDSQQRERLTAPDDPEAPHAVTKRGTTGLWDVRIDKPGKGYTQVPRAHIVFDEQTATLEVFTLQKKLLLEDTSPDVTMQHPPGEADYMHALIRLNDLTTASEGDTLPLHTLYLNNTPISSDDLSTLPPSYQNLFQSGPDDTIKLTHLQITPALRAIIQHEQKVVDFSTPAKEATKNLNHINDRIGSLFEDACSRVLDLPPNQRFLTQNLPADLEPVLRDQDDDFATWARGYARDNHKVTIKPDFIGSDGHLYEVKSGRTDTRSNTEQAHRMRLYALLSGNDQPITIITYDNASTPTPPEESLISTINFFDLPAYKEHKEVAQTPLQKIRHLLQVRNVILKEKEALS